MQKERRYQSIFRFEIDLPLQFHQQNIKGEADELRKMVFSQIMEYLPSYEFTKYVHHYRGRYKVKWIKQYFRIKKFYGTTENAVKSQIWIGVSVYVLIAIIKKRLDLDLELYTILQILSVALFEKAPLNELLTTKNIKTENANNHNQLMLF